MVRKEKNISWNNCLLALAKIMIAMFLIVGFSNNGKAQQISQISQYSMNDYIVNPAVAGSRDYFEGKLMNRNQWSGFVDAPRTFTLSLAAPFKNPKFAMGGYLFVDNVGPTRRTGLQVSYSYHLKINENMKLGLAASVGMLQFTIDGSRIELASNDDPALYNELNSQLVFDAKFGAYLYTDNWYAGFTLPQLMQNKIKLYESMDEDLNRLEDHYLLTGGYRFEITDDIELEPSVLVKYVNPAPIKVDASLKVIYKEMLWAGGSWRNNDAWVAMIGYEWNETLSLGYSFDFTTSNLKNYSNGTHEIVIGFRLNQ